MRAFCRWRVIHKEMTDIRTWLPSDLGALLCWSVKKWRWLWRSALNDAISLLMRWLLQSRPASGIRLGKWAFVSPPDRCAESRQSSKPVSASCWLFLSSHYATSCLFNQILIQYIFGSQNTSRPNMSLRSCWSEDEVKTARRKKKNVIHWKLLRMFWWRETPPNINFSQHESDTQAACLSTRDGMHFDQKGYKCTIFEVVREFFCHHFIVRFTKMLKPLIQSMCVLCTKTLHKIKRQK